MNHKRKVQIVTITLLLAALGAGVLGSQGWHFGDFTSLRRTLWQEPKPQEPEQIIHAMLDAARAGNVKAYLDCYTGGIENSLRQSSSIMTETNFSKYLRESTAAIKGIAVSNLTEI